MSETPESTPKVSPAAHLQSYRFQPGQSGNPGGRKGGVETAVRKLVGSDGRTILEVWCEVLLDARAARRDRLEAGKLLMERGFGKAPELVLSATVNAGSVDLQSLTDDHLSAVLQTLSSPGSMATLLPASTVDSAVDDALFEDIPPESLALSASDTVSTRHCAVPDSSSPSKETHTEGVGGGGVRTTYDPIEGAQAQSHLIPQNLSDKNSEGAESNFKKFQQGQYVTNTPEVKAEPRRTVTLIAKTKPKRKKKRVAKKKGPIARDAATDALDNALGESGDK